MSFENEYQRKRSVGPAIAAVVVGVILGGAAALGAGAMADSSVLPSAEEIAVNRDNAFLGSVQYGGRIEG